MTEITEEFKELKRSFGGKIKDFNESEIDLNFSSAISNSSKIVKIERSEEAYEKRHLKAYLKGQKLFRCGYCYYLIELMDDSWVTLSFSTKST